MFPSLFLRRYTQTAMIARTIRIPTGTPTLAPIFAAEEFEEPKGLAAEEVEVMLLIEVVVVSIIEVPFPSLAEEVVVHVLEETIDGLAEEVTVSTIGAAAVVCDGCALGLAMAEKPLASSTPSVVKVPRSRTNSFVEQQVDLPGPLGQQNVESEHYRTTTPDPGSSGEVHQ